MSNFRYTQHRHTQIRITDDGFYDGDEFIGKLQSWTPAELVCKYGNKYLIIYDCNHVDKRKELVLCDRYVPGTLTEIWKIRVRFTDIIVTAAAAAAGTDPEIFLV